MRLIEEIRTDNRFLKKLVIISIVISIILAIYICLPLIIPSLARPFYGFSTILVTTLNSLLGFLTFIIEIINLTGQAFTREKIKRAVAILFIVILPFALAQISEPILKLQLDNQDNSRDVTMNEVAEDEPHKKITVNYQAPLFNHIVSDEIRLQHADYEAAILNTICTKDEYINHNSNMVEYEQNTRSAQEYEMVYIDILQQNNFRTLRDERIRMIDQIITYRIQANNHYCYSDNQRLIGIGCQNMAYELYHIGETDNAVKHYEMSITWFLTAMTTAFNEPDSDANTFEQLLENIINSYQQISALTNEYTVEHKNAEALIMIYQDYSGAQFVPGNK